MTNIIVLPTLYEGTSFHEIATAFKLVAKDLRREVRFIGGSVVQNELPHNMLDDQKYIDGQIDVLQRMTMPETLYADESKILFLDAFFPGLDLIRYYHQQRGHEVTYGALIHGGTHLSNDLYDFPWLEGYENAWFNTYDVLYTSSMYSRSKLTDVFQKKARAFPWGMDAFTPKVTEKQIDVIFPHRLDRDKGADLLLWIAKSMPDVEFVITAPSSVSFTNNLYYDQARSLTNIKFLVGEDDQTHAQTLGRSKIVFSNSKQELYGYSVMKAVLSGCIPVLPNDQCYPEYFPAKYIYQDKQQACNLIRYYLENHQQESNQPTYQALQNKIRGHTFKQILDDFFNSTPPNIFCP